MPPADLSPGTPAARALAVLDQRWPTTRTRLLDLLAVPSVDGTDAEHDVQAHLAAAWREDGLDVDHWRLDLDTLLADPEFPGMEVERDEAWGLAARLHGTGEGPSLMLNGHVDVVPAGDRAAWSGDPFVPRVGARGGREVVVARGACDMKAGLVAAWAAVDAVSRAGITLRGDVVLASVVGEEDGGLGTFALLRHGVTADACVITEPTELDLVPANGGALTFRLVVPGVAVHASRRSEGVSALERFVPVMAALARLEAERNAEVDPLMRRWPLAYPLSIGRVECGDWASTVPDRLVAEGRLGVALGETVGQARAALEAAVAQACEDDPFLRDHPVVVQWWGGQFASGATAVDHPLLAAVRRAHESVGGARPEVYGGPYGSDLRLLVGLGGIPTLQYGPGDSQVAHSADEWVALDEVRHAAAALVVLLLEHQGVASLAP